MKIKQHTLKISRLIGKIDNDFNISESDWIPRVAAWVIDALSQMKVLPMERKRRVLEVSERIAQFPCCINADEIKVYDKNGCEISQLDSNSSCGCNINDNNYSPQEIAVIDDNNKSGVNFMNVGTVVNNSNRNFVLQGNNIELNFNTDKIIVETLEVATYYDEYYDCEVPYIYDDGLLLEALAWYCLFKYLSRGSKHTIYDLKSTNAVINPYMQWQALKVKAANSVKIKLNQDKGWRSFFYNSTFIPRG
jgi:hypothetical protein